MVICPLVALAHFPTYAFMVYLPGATLSNRPVVFVVTTVVPCNKSKETVGFDPSLAVTFA